LNSAHSDALLGLAQLRLEQGQPVAAIELLERILARDPENVIARSHTAECAKVKPDDAHFAALRRRFEAARSGSRPLDGQQAIALHFALGKCHDDVGDYGEAFAHFAEANRRMRATLRYDASKTARQFEAVRHFFTAEKFRQLRPAQPDDANVELPVFVLGMPRSGTTLVEQILSSHPKVHGAGELRELLSICQQPTAALPGGNAAAYPDNLAQATPQTLAIWGADYLNRLRRLAPDARRITDKMPTNFFALGLIHLMLPGARIVHVRRDPLDTCLSNFFHNFNTRQEYTYDLRELGHYYTEYEKLMEHWRSVLPADSFIEVQYEDIVADLEGQARRLLDYCGLDWSDACLDFHRNTRDVRTASVMQVRQPLYRNSVQRWRNYAAFLGPLREALEQ
jgi:tetratricopeptide (TPR) repeat protein